ncbi:ABC-type sugar transport system, ATPase component [Candidatus Burkholderia verschuerenii]|uniref:ABC-type sugar transport system, ATPase component n=1 Tax=Candidatus Burkholderia verschuerenii TaxID=242163 RepID=A0A0L0MA31_9BURK|nr:ABC-type sugar transport system, ATPase component [Candidatus Burkholderia verschuerenii]
MHRMLVVSTVMSAAAALAACGTTTSGPELRASKPVINVSSARSASDISSCLLRMIPSAQTVRDQGNTEVLVGSNAWLVTLIPSAYGSIVKVQQSSHDDGGVLEPKLRFDIARCTV